MEDESGRKARRDEQRTVVLLLAAFLLLMQVIFTFAAALHGYSWGPASAELTMTTVMGVVAYGSHLLLRRAANRPFWQQVLLGCIVAFLGTALFVVMRVPISQGLLSSSRHAFDARLLREWVLMLPALAFWSALSIALSFSLSAREHERRRAAAELLAQRAQTQALRYQINPHFLFNTLNSISTLVWEGDNEAAKRMIIALSDFFRASLAIDPHEDVTLAQEIALQRLYLEIEQARFPDRLAVEIAVPDELSDALVPSLILQPLVENAVKYAVAPSKAKTWLRIAARHRHDELVLEVEDSGAAAAGTPPSGTGVGLDNVRERLRMRFGALGLLQTERKPEGGFVATLCMPLRMRPEGRGVYAAGLRTDKEAASRSAGYGNSAVSAVPRTVPAPE